MSISFGFCGIYRSPTAPHEVYQASAKEALRPARLEVGTGRWDQRDQSTGWVNQGRRYNINVLIAFHLLPGTHHQMKGWMVEIPPGGSLNIHTEICPMVLQLPVCCVWSLMVCWSFAAPSSSPGRGEPLVLERTLAELLDRPLRVSVEA